MEKDIHVEVINLDRSTDRWQSFLEWNHGFSDFNRFSAVNAKDFNYLKSDLVSPKTKLYIKGNVKRSFNDINSVGAIGCSLSHYMVLKNFYDDKTKGDYLIIFEDDIDLNKFKNQTKTYAEQVVEEFKKLPSNDWDIWLLGMNFSTSMFGQGFATDTVDWKINHIPEVEASSCLTNPTSYKSPPLSRYMEAKQFIGTHAIMFKRESIPKILKYFFPIEVHYDSYLSYLSQLGEIRVIAVQDFLLSQNYNYQSTIGHETQTIEILGQYDAWYKLAFYVLIIMLIMMITVYIVIYCRNRSGEDKTVINKL